MSETKETGDKSARPGARKPVSAQRTESSGHVQQNFSHGRKNVVVVERKKTRKIMTPGAAEDAPAAAASSAAPARGAPAPAGRRPGLPGGLSTGEVDKRTQAIQTEKKRQEDEAQRRALDAEQRRIEAAAEAERQRVEDEERRKAEAELAKSNPEAAAAAAAEAAAKPAAQAPAAAPSARSPSGMPERVAPRPISRPAPVEAVVARDATARTGEIRAPRGRAADQSMREDEEANSKRSKPGLSPKPTRSPPKADERRASGRLTVDKLLNDEQRERSLASLRRKRERDQRRALGIQQTREKIMREVIIPEVITIQELANRMTEKSVDVIRLLMKQGTMHTINDAIDADTAELIVTEFGHKPKRVSEADVEEGFIGAKDEDLNLQPRAPVVTIMGHVDHGKTSLLDAIRQANVASGEAGGITQHIGAYQVTTPDGHKITFIDTPGHEAFTAMRARGAKVTDIVILVVAADDGVMPQTVEAINHAKAANVPIIVAINKIDKPAADPKRVTTELLQHEIVVESLSGETLDIQVSALKKTNLDKLLEGIILQSEILELRANPERSAEGYVIEAKLERGRGPVGTLLVQRGSLKVGDIIVAGSSWGRVRALLDDKGKVVVTAGPSVPVEVLGFDSAPEAGDQFAVVESEARAREITDYRVRKRREALGSAGTARTLEQMMQQLKEAGKKEFPLVVKGDVQGSLEAIMGSLAKLGNEEVAARIVHSGVGQITEFGCGARAGVEGHHSGLQRSRQRAGQAGGRQHRHRDPLLFDHLRSRRRGEGGHVRPARADEERGVPRLRVDQTGLQYHQAGQGCRLPGHRRQGRARRQGASAPRQDRYPRRHAVHSEALQG